MFYYILLLLISIIFYVITSHFNYWKNLKIDGPKPMLLFGSMFPVFTAKKHFGEIYDDMYKKFNKAAYVGFYRFTTAAILLRDTDLIKSVTVENFNNFHDNDFELDEKLDPLLSTSSFFARGEKWKLYRSHVSPLFTTIKVKAVFPLIKAASDKLVMYIDKMGSNNSNGFEAKEICAKFTIESVASCAFGLEANAFNKEESTFVKNSRQVFEISMWQQIRFILAQFLPVINKIVKLPLLPNSVDHWLRSIVGQVIRHRDSGAEKRIDFLQHVLDAREKSNINEDAVIGHSLTFLTEGFETSSIVMSYCLYELAKNSVIQRKVQQEIDEKIKQNNNEITADFLTSLSYLDQVINETLRMHSPVFALTRICTKEFQLPPQYPGGKNGPTVTPGMPIAIPVYPIHYDPVYYPNPTVFDPDRFTENKINERDRYSFLAFGEGPRICLGMKFGLMQVKTGLSNVLLNYGVEVSSKTIEPLKFSKITLMKTCEEGIWLKFIKRN